MQACMKRSSTRSLSQRAESCDESAGIGLIPGRGGRDAVSHDAVRRAARAARHRTLGLSLHRLAVAWIDLPTLAVAPHRFRFVARLDAPRARVVARAQSGSVVRATRGDDVWPARRRMVVDQSAQL